MNELMELAGQVDDPITRAELATLVANRLAPTSKALERLESRLGMDSSQAVISGTVVWKTDPNVAAVARQCYRAVVQDQQPFDQVVAEHGLDRETLASYLRLLEALPADRRGQDVFGARHE